MARLAAAKVIHAVTVENAFSNESAAFHLASPDLDARDRSFASALIFGTLSYLPLIDYYISQASSRPLNKLDPWVLTVLRMGVWQLFFSYHVPQRTAVDESVKLARFFVGERVTGFVNGMMRALTRKKPTLPEAGKRALELGLTQELFSMLERWYGEEQASAIGEHALQSPDYVPIRANMTRLKEFDQWAGTEEAQALNLSKLAWPEMAYGIEPSGSNVTQLSAYRNGLFSLQSQSAMLVGALSRIKPEDKALDLCAAPGGKITHLAELKGNDRGLVACDISEERLRSLDIMSRRLGFNSIEQHQMDATEHHEAFDNSFDIVLCDVPCTGLGLLQRRPEIRFRVNAETVNRLLPVQRMILFNGSKAVAPGGILMYSTCTINPEENEYQVKAFLATDEGRAFELEDLEKDLPASLLNHRVSPMSNHLKGTVLLLPHRHGTDGFFIARMRRKC